jgi:hypothetical protein
MSGYLTMSRLLVLIAVIVFVLAAVGVAAPVSLVALGLAVWAAAQLVP